MACGCKSKKNNLNKLKTEKQNPDDLKRQLQRYIYRAKMTNPNEAVNELFLALSIGSRDIDFRKMIMSAMINLEFNEKIEWLDIENYILNINSNNLVAIENTRTSCMDCTEKHLGAASVLIEECRSGYPHRLRAIGHLHEAEEESQEWEELHDYIRDSRKQFQSKGIIPNFEELEELINKIKQKGNL